MNRALPLAFLSFFAFVSVLPAAQPLADTYDSHLDSLVVGMASPLIDVLTQAKKPKISVALLLIREAGTGQRSELAQRLEQDLGKKMRASLVFGMPDAYHVKQALSDLDGEQSDLRQELTFKKIAKRLGVDAMVTGEYLLGGQVLTLQLHVINCSSNAEVWKDSQSMPFPNLKEHETDLLPGTQPANYIQPAFPAVSADTRQEAAPEQLKELTVTSEVLQAMAMERENAQKEFSWNRVNLGIGYSLFNPQNSTFHGAVGAPGGAYVNLSWADVLSGEFDYWSASSNLTDISSLTAYGFSLSATCPYRIGYYTILYGGLGGRMEGIQVNSATLSSQYGVSYGNNSFFFTAGGRLHFGPYGLDLRVSDDVMANYTGYLTVKLGLNYEYDTN